MHVLNAHYIIITMKDNAYKTVQLNIFKFKMCVNNVIFLALHAKILDKILAYHVEQPIIFYWMTKLKLGNA